MAHAGAQTLQCKARYLLYQAGGVLFGGFPKFGVRFWGSHSILGSVFGSPYLRKLPKNPYIILYIGVASIPFLLIFHVVLHCSY